MRFLNPRKLQPLRRVMARKMPHETQRVGPAMSMSLSTTAWMLPLLHQSLGLPSRDPEPGTTAKIPKKPPVDPLLVSIDCEFIPHGTSRTIREIGISTLDTRRLKDLSSSSSISEFQNVIRTFNFTFIDLKKAKNQRPPRIFGFDHHAKASKSELRQVLHDFTTTNSSAGAPRDVLIVGHGISADILSMTRERFHLPNVEVLDTASVAARLFSSSQKLEVLDMEKAKGLKGALSLRRLIGKLGMPFRKRLFHNAGNDSHMTMRLLLQLGVESAVGTCQTVEHQSRVSVLRAIANSPLAKLSMHDESLFGHMQLRKIDERRNAYVQELAQREANALKSKAPTNTSRTPAPVDTETSSVSVANSNVPQNDTSIQLEPSSILDLDSDPSR